MGSPEPTHVVSLHEPRVAGQEVTFSWDVRPETKLYEQTHFHLRFPEQVPIDNVPVGLWWRLLLLSLHGQLALLRPCRVELPVRLGASEREFWMRMIDHVARQLEIYGIQPRSGRAAEIVESGPGLEPFTLSADRNRVAVAYSGGKDSMVVSALAAELTERPLLVAITSPLPSVSRDQIGAARDRALADIGKRIPVDVLEVHSDFRTIWKRDFAERLGCLIGVHEISDLPFYQATVAAVAAAKGIGTCLMASEADIQYNRESRGGLILHREFVSSSVTQSAVGAVLAPFGLRQASLTYPIHMPQVQTLLLTRYRKLADLQYSCTMAPEGEQACNACEKCLQVGLVALGQGISPRVVGIDPVRLLCEFGDWPLERNSTDPSLGDHHFALQHILRALQNRTLDEAAALLAADSTGRNERHRGQALAVYARMRAQALARVTPPAPGYVTDFLKLVPADLREDLRGILDQHFAPTTDAEFRAMAERARALTGWIAAPLEADSRRSFLRRAAV